jgi:hypothetical protein
MKGGKNNTRKHRRKTRKSTQIKINIFSYKSITILENPTKCKPLKN